MPIVPSVPPMRSMLFTPGDRHDLVAKAVASGTDAVIVDLEDSVAVERKPEARAGLADLPPSPIPVFVRTNSIETGHLWDDVLAAGQADIDGLVIPKAESACLLREIDGALRILEMASGRTVGSITLIPLIESSVGVRATFEMMSVGGRVASVLFGGGEQGDLVADLGVEWTEDGTGLMYARSQVLLDARAAGCRHPMEAVFMDFRNLDGLRIECELARRLGYVGKVAIHPAQIPVIHEIFTPSAEEVAHHRRIITEFDKALAQGQASIQVDGKMVDYAVARVARTVLDRAELADQASTRIGRADPGAADQCR